MIRTTTFAISAICALALPIGAYADAPAAAGNNAATQNNCSNCDQVCAQRDQAAAQARAERRRVAARHRAHHVVTASAGPTTMHIDSQISRNVATGCEYHATAQGTYRSTDVTGRLENQPIRDVDVRADASLTCNGQVVRREQQRFVFPATTRGNLAELMHSRLGTQVPGTSCTWAATYGYQGGNLEARSIESSCSRPQQTAAIEGYQQQGYTSGAARNARGGGPRKVHEPIADDARSSAH